MDCSPPVFSVHGILQERILKWVAISFSRGSSWPSDGTCVCCPGRWILYHRTILEANLYLGAKKILNLHWSSLYFNLYFMSSVHFLNIFIISPTIFWGKEPMLLPMSFMSFWKNSRLCFQVSAHSRALQFLTEAHLPSYLHSFAPLVKFHLIFSSPNQPQNLGTRRFSLVFFLYVKKPTPWKITWMVLSSSKCFFIWTKLNLSFFSG